MFLYTMHTEVPLFATNTYSKEWHYLDPTQWLQEPLAYVSQIWFAQSRPKYLQYLLFIHTFWSMYFILGGAILCET